jgi:hypothetical protein
MNVQSWRFARRLACGALSLGLIAGAPMLAGGAMGQTTLVDPRGPKEGMSPHDAALAAAGKGDYIVAADLAKQAAAAGQPLDADQVDFITGKAAKQQAAAEAAAKLKVAQEAAAATAQQILNRQQKEYNARDKERSDACGSQGSTHIGIFTSAAGSAGASGGAQSPKFTGADPSGKPPGC